MENNFIYTKESWELDGSFSAEAGQEISAEVYNDMLNCMPPLSLPRATAEHALSVLKIPVHAGFLMGEPHSNDSAGQLYLAFGMNDYGKGKHYYYLGLSHEEKRTPAGFYYCFDCLNAFVSNRLFKASAFENDQEAIDFGANYEATVYKLEFNAAGEKVSSALLYDPYDCFN